MLANSLEHKDMHPLRIARRQRNLTIEQLANEAHVGASTLWRAEHDHPINAESRQRLCTYFAMTAQELGLLHDQDTSAIVPFPQIVPADTHFTPSLVQETCPVYSYHHDVLRHSRTISLELQQNGSWLAASASNLAALFDNGWTVDAVLDSLQIALRSIEGMPIAIRQGLTAGANDMLITRERISSEERLLLSNTLRKSVAEGWQMFHTARPSQVLVVAQAQLYLVQQTHAFLSADLRYSLYAALYNLIGAAYFFQGHYESAQRAYERAHIAALEGADIWNMAQSLNWQAIVSSASNQHAVAIEAIETALRLLVNEREEQYVRLKAHLLADWAYNASLLREHTSVREKLAESSTFLAHLGPNEEFDEARWHQIAGSCMLKLNDYTAAIEHLELSLAQLPPQWISRRILTLIPLAETYARKHDREASITIAERIAPLINTMDSTMLQQRFEEYQQLLVSTFPHDTVVQAFIQKSQQRLLSNKS
jgi:tetratricopeptide (TPR) repeat protein